jgi:hypothetical protein
MRSVVDLAVNVDRVDIAIDPWTVCGTTLICVLNRSPTDTAPIASPRTSVTEEDLRAPPPPQSSPVLLQITAHTGMTMSNQIRPTQYCSACVGVGPAMRRKGGAFGVPPSGRVGSLLAQLHHRVSTTRPQVKLCGRQLTAYGTESSAILVWISCWRRR